MKVKYLLCILLILHQIRNKIGYIFLKKYNIIRVTHDILRDIVKEKIMFRKKNLQTEIY